MRYAVNLTLESPIKTLNFCRHPVTASFPLSTKRHVSSDKVSLNGVLNKYTRNMKKILDHRPLSL